MYLCNDAATAHIVFSGLCLRRPIQWASGVAGILVRERVHPVARVNDRIHRGTGATHPSVSI